MFCLLEIKTGKWSPEKVKAEAEKLFKELRDAHDRSKLPEEPNRQGVDLLCRDLVRVALEERGEV